MAHRVTAQLIVAPVKVDSGKLRDQYLARGDLLPTGVPEADVKRLVAEGYVERVASAPVEKKAPAKPAGKK